MLKNLQEMYFDLERCHDQVLTELMRLEEDPPTDLGELADAAYVMRETLGKITSMSGVVKRVRKKVDSLACLIFVSQPLMEGNIKTKHCTATPDFKMGASIPSKKHTPDEYFELMRFLEVSDEFAERELFKVHWPNFVEYISELTSMGKTLPDGIDVDKTYPIYKLTIRRKNPIND